MDLGNRCAEAYLFFCAKQHGIYTRYLMLPVDYVLSGFAFNLSFHVPWVCFRVFISWTTSIPRTFSFSVPNLVLSICLSELSTR